MLFHRENADFQAARPCMEQSFGQFGTGLPGSSPIISFTQQVSVRCPPSAQRLFRSLGHTNEQHECKSPPRRNPCSVRHSSCPRSHERSVLRETGEMKKAWRWGWGERRHAESEKLLRDFISLRWHGSPPMSVSSSFEGVGMVPSSSG